MNAEKLISLLNGQIIVGPNTCDSVKIGDTKKEIHKVAVCMMGTAETIEKAHAWGADMLIVHEPLYYDNADPVTDNPIVQMKHKLLESTGMVVYRYHDHAHSEFRKKDLITEGELLSLGLEGKLEQSGFFASYYFTPDQPVTGREILKRCEERLGLKHVRAAGNLDGTVKKMAACFGTPGGIMELLTMDDIDLLITGEICEWAHGELVRDAAYFGKNKCLLVLTHEGSEREGMKLMTERMKEKFTDLDIQYFECGEVYIN